MRMLCMSKAINRYMLISKVENALCLFGLLNFMEYDPTSLWLSGKHYRVGVDIQDL